MGGISSEETNTGKTLGQWGSYASDIESNLYQDWRGFKDSAVGGGYDKAFGGANELADMLKRYSEGGNLPTSQDAAKANELANNLFASRQTGLNQMFQDQTMQANRQAAIMGRSIDDPILQAKLRTEQMRLQGSLDSDKQGFTAQFAQDMPGQRLGFKQAQVGILNNLAQQAMANRQAILAMGSGLLQQAQNYQLATSGQYQRSGGGVFQDMNAVLGMGGKIGGAIATGGATLGMPDMKSLFAGATGPGAAQSYGTSLTSGGQAVQGNYNYPIGPNLPSSYKPY